MTDAQVDFIAQGIEPYQPDQSSEHWEIAPQDRAIIAADLTLALHKISRQDMLEISRHDMLEQMD